MFVSNWSLNKQRILTNELPVVDPNYQNKVHAAAEVHATEVPNRPADIIYSFHI